MLDQIDVDKWDARRGLHTIWQHVGETTTVYL